MNKLFYSLSALIITMCICSCEKSDPDRLVITSLGDTGTVFGKGGSQTSVSFTTNVKWTAEVTYQGSETGWVVMSPSSGKAGDIKMSVTVAANGNYDSRSAEITITAGKCVETFKLSQSQKDGMTLISDKEADFAPDGGTMDVTLNTNLTCKATTKSKWLTVSPATKALVDKTFTITVLPNETYFARTDSVMFTSQAGDFVEKVVISQAQKDVFESENTSHEFTCEEAEFKASVLHNVDFKVEVSESWITYSTGEFDDYSLTTPLLFKVDKNETYDSRSGEVKITSPLFDAVYTIVVVQAQTDVMTLDSAPHSLETAGGSFAVSVFHNIPLALSYPEWMVCTEGEYDRQTKTTLLSCSAGENPNNDPRSGEIIITGKNTDFEQSISVLQEGQMDVIVEIPDVAFNAYVLKNFDKNGDGKIKIGEANLITDVDCHSMGIGSLTGIETFANLAKLVCHGNKLKTIDVSNNKKLVRMECANNQLTSLKVADGTTLTYLDCSNNRLAALDLSSSPSIETLHCYKNKLTVLDTSKITDLRYLIASDNLFTSYDGSGNPLLAQLGLANNLLTSVNIPTSRTLQSLNLRNNRFTGKLEITSMAKNNAKVYCSGNPYIDSAESLPEEEWPEQSQRLNELTLNLDTFNVSETIVDPWTTVKYVIVVDGGIE